MKRILGIILTICMLSSILPTNVFAVSMSTSLETALVAAALAQAEPDTPFAEEPEELRDVIPFTVAAPTLGQKHVGNVTTSHPEIEISNVAWVGELNKDGTYIAGKTYDVIITFKIKGNVNKILAANIKYKKTTVNGEEISYDVSQRSDRAGYVRKTFEVKPPKPVVNLKNVFTQAQADERWVTVYPMHPTEIIIKEGEKLTDVCDSSTVEMKNCVKKIVLDYTYNSTQSWYHDAYRLDRYPNLEELWLGPNVDPELFLNHYYDDRFGFTGDEITVPYDTVNIDSQKATIFLPEANAERLPERKDIYKRSTLKLYSGELMDAYKKGPSAGYDMCTNHDYSQLIYTPDRVAVMKNCMTPIKYYYSCSVCGKCEYNPNHISVIVSDVPDIPSDHYFTERNLSDKYFVGLNSRGERVYWKSCSMCGKIYNAVRASNESEALPEHALEQATLKMDFAHSFAVRNDRYVTAKMSNWAQNEVQWASQNGILDTSLLGNDYTKPITRLQFASIAVKLAEVLTGSAITPAPQGTFVDTDNEYALKAYASGITSGVSATEFAPNGTLTRQQMATFIYRALMYVRDNTNIRYTTYTPALEKYSDNWAIQDWAKTSMGFMNALGLVKGVSDAAIDPDGKCTIEQAALVANRSVNADQIGWYQMPYSTEEGLLIHASEFFESRYYFAPTAHAPTQTTYYNGARVWVDEPEAGCQKASENPSYIENVGVLHTTEPFTGVRAYVPSTNFRPIKDLKDTDVADFNQYYSN